MSRRLELGLRVAFLVVFGVICVWWAFNLPYAPYGVADPFTERMAPDENVRFDVLQWIVEHGSLPRGDEPELLNPSWGFSYALSVYGSTLLSVPGALVANALGGGVEGMVLAARLTDVGLSVATLAILFCVSDRFFGLVATRFLFVGLVGFLPQFVFLSCYLNCEALDLFSVALTTLCLVKGIEGRWGMVHCCALGIALGICALSYYFAYGIFPVAIVVYYVSVCRIRRCDGNLVPWRDLVVQPLVVALCAFAVCGWFFLRNLALHGDFFGMRTQSELGELHALEELKPSNRVTPRSLGMSVPEMVLGTDDGPFAPWGIMTFESAVGTFGMMRVFLGSLEYLAYGLIIGVGLVAGIVRFVLDQLRDRAGRGWRWLLAVAIAIMVVLTIAFALYYSWASDYQPQGRYAMAAMPAIMLVVAYGYGSGWTSHEERGGRHLRASESDIETESAGSGVTVSRWIAWAMLGIWIALFAWVFITVIVPFASAPLFSLGL